MVDTPQLTPTPAAGRRGSAQEVPTIRRDLQVNLRNIPTVQPRGLEAAARAFNVSAQVFGELQRTFQISAEEGLQEIRREQQVEAEKIYSEKRLEIEAGVAEVEANPEINNGDIAGATLGIYDTATEQALENTKSPYQRRYLEEKFARTRTEVGTRAIRKQAQKEMAEREVDFARKLEANQSIITASPETYSEVLTEQLEALEMSDIDPAQKPAVEKEIKEAFAVSRVRGLIRDNPEQAAEALADEEFTKDLDDQSMAAASEDVRAALEKEQRVAELAFKSSRGQKYQELKDKAGSGELSNTEVNDLLEAGEIAPEQAGELVTGIQEELEASEQKANEIDEVLGAINGIDVITGADTRKVNTAYKEAIAPFLQNADPATAMKTKARFVESTNKIPSLLSQELKGQLSGGSPDQKLEAARLVDLIRQKSPFAASNSRDLSSTTQANADRILGLLEAGISENDVLETLEKQDSQVNQATSEIRRKEFKKAFDETKATTGAKDTFDSIIPFDRPDIAAETGTEARLLDDMRVLAEKYYVDNPDMDKALEYAQNQIKRQYGVTKTGGGGRRLMKYAPETFYSVDGETDWIGSQLEADVSSIRPGATKDNIFLVPDRQTAREAAEGLPAYTVMVKNEDGTLDALPQRWSPNLESQKQIAKENRISKAREKFDRAKKMANRRQSFRELMTANTPGTRGE